jgi:hypothetical protein
MKKKLAAYLCILGVLLVGCAPNSGSDNENVSEPQLGAIPTITDTSQIVWAIDEYLPNPDQMMAILVSARNYVNRCAEAAGTNTRYEYSVSDDVLREAYGSELQDRNVYSSMWGFFNSDMTVVTEFGYARPVQSPDISMGGRNDQAFAHCEDLVSSITPGGGAFLPHYGASNLPNGGSDFRREDSRFQAAVAEWSKCMAGKGFNYDNLNNFPLELWNPTTDEQRNESIATATADVQCKIETNLVGIAVAVQSAYDQEYIDKNRDALAEQQKYIEDFIAGKIPVPDEVPEEMRPETAESSS